MTHHSHLNTFPAANVRSGGPLVYTVSLLEPDAHHVDIMLELSSDGRALLELMMPIWSPGFYRVEAYAEQVQRLAAHTPEGVALAIERPALNRWRIHVPDAASMIRVTYRLVCTASTVTTNWIGTDFAILNGPATFITLADTMRRRHELVLQLPAHWDQVCTSLSAIDGSLPNRYYADDYDTLVDAPIVIGTPIRATFVVNERRHDLIAVGDMAQWDGAHGT
jgi:predicted metalloprotease with PDZ domain